MSDTLQENHGVGVVISASGSHVTKAVTVTELLKRRVAVSNATILYLRCGDMNPYAHTHTHSLRV